MNRGLIKLSCRSAERPVRQADRRAWRDASRRARDAEQPRGGTAAGALPFDRLSSGKDVGGAVALACRAFAVGDVVILEGGAADRARTGTQLCAAAGG